MPSKKNLLNLASFYGIALFDDLCIMKYVFLLLLILISNASVAQAKTDSCGCSARFSVSYPKQAEGISAVVSVEFDRDDSCRLSNPVIIKKAGHGFDEEVMRLMQQVMTRWNQCIQKCNLGNCKKGKYKQDIKFLVPEE